MKRLIGKIRKVKRSPTADVIRVRLEEFKALGRKGSREMFKELCFCVLTANYSAEGGIRIQNEVGDGFCELDEAGLAGRLKGLGYRFPNKRAHYICCSNHFKDDLKRILAEEPDKRAWLVKNIKGLGMKEASHFLRNIGFEDYAIIDFHIVDLLEKEGLIKRPKTLTLKAYIEIEEVLKGLASRLGMGLGELDLYLWYLETGKVLK